MFSLTEAGEQQIGRVPEKDQATMGAVGKACHLPNFHAKIDSTSAKYIGHNFTKLTTVIIIIIKIVIKIVTLVKLIVKLLGVEDVSTGHITIEHRLTNLLFSLFSLFFCPFVFYCSMPNVSSQYTK